MILHARDPHRGLCVLFCSQAAYQLGVRRGMPLAEATSFAPAAYLAPHHPQADVEAVEALAQWCERFSPIVGIGPSETRGGGHLPVGRGPDHLYLDATDLASHFGGEQAMAQQIAQAFEHRGYCVRVALAGTLGAAWALAYYATHTAQPLVAPPTGAAPSGSTFLVVPAAASWAALQRLPVRALRLPPDTVAMLEQLGVLQIGQLAQLPRSSWASRFGPLLLQRWDQLLGQVCEPLVAHRAPPVFQAELHLEHPTDHHPLIASLLTPLITQVARALQARSEGVLELICRFRCSTSTGPSDAHQERSSRSLPVGSQPAESLSLRIGLFQPTASAEHLVQLVQMQLEQLVLPGWVEQVAVAASLTAPLARRQRELFPDGSRRAVGVGRAGRSFEQSVGSCRGRRSPPGSRGATRTGLSVYAAHRAAPHRPPHAVPDAPVVAQSAAGASAALAFSAPPLGRRRDCPRWSSPLLPRAAAYVSRGPLLGSRTDRNGLVARSFGASRLLPR